MNKFCVENTFLTAQNSTFKQITDLPMGSTLSPVVADIVMEHIETTAINSFDSSVEIYKRYVDDTFVVIQENQIQPFHLHLNSLNSKIILHLKENKIKSLPFIDVLVH